MHAVHLHLSLVFCLLCCFILNIFWLIDWLRAELQHPGEAAGACPGSAERKAWPPRTEMLWHARHCLGWDWGSRPPSAVAFRSLRLDCTSSTAKQLLARKLPDSRHLLGVMTGNKFRFMRQFRLLTVHNRPDINGYCHRIYIKKISWRHWHLWTEKLSRRSIERK